MDAAAELAGYYAAHAVWCLSTNDHMSPLLATLNAAGRRKLTRLAGADEADAVAQGQQHLADNPTAATAAVLIYEACITRDSATTDALAIVIKAYGPPPATVTVVVPFTPRLLAGKLKLAAPQVAHWHGGTAGDASALLTHLLAGVARHEQGAVVWQRALAAK